MNNRNFFLTNIKKMLKEAKHVSISNIQVNRPHPLLLRNVPIICIYQGDEHNEPRSGGGGSQYQAKTYHSTFTVKIDIVIDVTTNADMILNEYAGEVEDVLLDDIFFEKVTGTNQGDNEGILITGTSPYNFDDGSENLYSAVSISVDVRYIVDTIPAKRTSLLEGVDGEIKPSNSTEDTVPMGVKVDTNTTENN